MALVRVMYLAVAKAELGIVQDINLDTTENHLAQKPIAMYDNYNYPMGADNENAPWNDHDPDPVSFECKVTVIMNREVDVDTKNYYQEPPEPWNGINSWNYDTSDVDWHEEYDEQYMSVPDLLTNMRTLLLKLDVTNLTSAERDMYDRVLEESQGWEEEDTDVEKL